MKTKSKSKYYIQCTTWKDRKKVVFLSNKEVVYSDGYSIKRNGRGKKVRDVISGPRAQAE